MGAVAECHDMDPTQLVQLEEACRSKDRLDRMDTMVRVGSSTWGHVGVVTLTLDAQRSVNQTAGLDEAAAGIA